MSGDREQFIANLAASTGKTPEQAEALMDILASGFARRGWIEGEPLPREEIGERLDKFLDRSEVVSSTEQEKPQ